MLAARGEEISRASDNVNFFGQQEKSAKTGTKGIRPIVPLRFPLRARPSNPDP